MKVLVAVLLLTTIASASQAQTPHVLNGIVRDTTGGAVSGAEVEPGDGRDLRPGDSPATK